MASRVTQHVVEVLTTTTPAARVTQQVVEALTLPAPAVQVSQVAAEVLRTGTAVPAQLSQVVLEVLSAPPPTLAGPHVYWRLQITSTQHGTYAAMAEVEMHTMVGGGDQCTGGTASALSTYSGLSAANAVDNNTTTLWASNGGFPVWWRYQFASAVEVREYTIRNRADESNQGPRDFTLEYSDDGSTWTVADTRLGEANWTTNETRTYLVEATRYRFAITANNGAINTAIAEVEMRATMGGADQCTGGIASASGSVGGSETPSSAFDNNSATQWRISSTTGWLQYEFVGDVTVVEYVIGARNSFANIDSPRDWTLEYSTNGSTWTVVDTRLQHTGWSDGETRTFVVGGQAYYRLNIVTNNGGMGTAIAEVEMRATIGGGDQCSGGTATASGSVGGSETASSGFDNNTATQWRINTSFPSWLQYQFPGELTVAQYTLQARTDWPTDTPSAWTLEYSRGDGVWTVVDTRTAQTAWSASEVRTYTLAAAPVTTQPHLLVVT